MCVAFVKKKRFVAGFSDFDLTLRINRMRSEWTCVCADTTLFTSKTVIWTSWGEKFLLKSKPHSPTATTCLSFNRSCKKNDVHSQLALKFEIGFTSICFGVSWKSKSFASCGCTPTTAIEHNHRKQLESKSLNQWCNNLRHIGVRRPTNLLRTNEATVLPALRAVSNGRIHGTA